MKKKENETQENIVPEPKQQAILEKYNQTIYLFACSSGANSSIIG